MSENTSLAISSEQKLNTIQVHEKLNDVIRLDEPGPGGAYHDYLILPVGAESMLEEGDSIDIAELGGCWIEFQKGPRSEESSRHGVIDSDLLEIVRDRLTAFQNGPFACEYNQLALEYVEKALTALKQRVDDRIERNVLGKNVE